MNTVRGPKFCLGVQYESTSPLSTYSSSLGYMTLDCCSNGLGFELPTAMAWAYSYMWSLALGSFTRAVNIVKNAKVDCKKSVPKEEIDIALFQVFSVQLWLFQADSRCYKIWSFERFTLRSEATSSRKYKILGWRKFWDFAVLQLSLPVD